MLGWKSEYETGVQHLDDQHRKLFEIAGRGYELLKDDFCTDKYDRIVQIIEELKDYTIFHFATEEEYLLKIGYKGFLSHKVEHDDFVKKFNEIDYKRLDEGQNSYIIDLLDFIYRWIDQHILKRDRYNKK